MTDRELLQQSLDAHLYHRDQTRPIDRTDAVIAALRARLAQPAPAVPTDLMLAASAAWKSYWQGGRAHSAALDFAQAMNALDEAIAAQPAPAVARMHCNCEWEGETQVQQCTLHAAHVDAIHEWADRAKAAEARIAAPVPEWRQAVATAYGWLWHINNEPMAPVPMLDEGKAAYAARKALRDLMTHEERGIAINAVHDLIAAEQGATK